MTESAEGGPNFLEQPHTRRNALKIGAGMIAAAIGGLAFGEFANKTGATDHTADLQNRGNPNLETNSSPVQAQEQARPTEQNEILPYESKLDPNFVFDGAVAIHKKGVYENNQEITLNVRTSPELIDDAAEGKTNRISINQIKELHGVNIEDSGSFIIENPTFVTVEDRQTGEVLTYIQIHARVNDTLGRDDEKDIYIQVSDLTEGNMEFEPNPKQTNQSEAENGLLFAWRDENNFLHTSTNESHADSIIRSSRDINVVSIPESPKVPQFPPTD